MQSISTEYIGPFLVILKSKYWDSNRWCTVTAFSRSATIPFPYFKSICNTHSLILLRKTGDRSCLSKRTWQLISQASLQNFMISCKCSLTQDISYRSRPCWLFEKGNSTYTRTTKILVLNESYLVLLAVIPTPLRLWPENRQYSDSNWN